MSAPDWARSRAELDAGIDALGLSVSFSGRDRLIGYLETLAAWNQTYNLTAVREPGAMIARHLLDCLAVLPALCGQTLVDIGSGAGLPGVIVAIARPGLNVTLIESSRKKAAFLRHVKRELALDTVTVAQARVERWPPAHAFDTAVCRAFATIANTLAQAGHVLADDGRFLFMKGRHPADELAELPPDYHHVETRALDVPGLDAARHLTVVQRGLP